MDSHQVHNDVGKNDKSNDPSCNQILLALLPHAAQLNL
jgi:hypothetical protein